MSRDVWVALTAFEAMIPAFIVCSLLQRKYTIRLTWLVRIFGAITMIVLWLGIEALDALRSANHIPAPPALSRSTG